MEYYTRESERERERRNVKNSIIYTNWNILKSIRKCGDAWRMTRGIGSLKSLGYMYVATTSTITTAATDRLSCVFIVYPSGTNEVQPVCLQQSGEASPSLTLILSGCLPPWMTMSMTNHGQHVKNLSWNIWAVNLEEQFLFPKLNSFLKLVHKYCYKCVESKQLETNERSTAFPGTACSLSLSTFWFDLKWLTTIYESFERRGPPLDRTKYVSLEYTNTTGTCFRNLWQYFHMGNMTNINKQLTKY